MKLRVPILALAVCLALLAGCGGSSNDSGAVKLVKDAFGKSIGSALVNVDLTANLNGSPTLKGPVTLKLSGPYSSNGSSKLPSFDWNLAIAGGGTNFDGRLTSTGDDFFVGFGGQSYEAGKTTIARYNQQLSQQSGQKKKRLRDFGIDPASWIQGAQRKGDATVAGAPTTHVSASVDFNKVLVDLNSLIKKAGSTVPGARAPAQLNEKDRKRFSDAIKSSSFDVYVGKTDGKIHRAALSVQFELSKPASNGVKSGTVSFSLQYSNIGQPQTIKAPASAKPLSDLTTPLGAGAALQGQGGTGSGGTAQQKRDAYAKCLDSAPAGDVNALTRCQALLR